MVGGLSPSPSSAGNIWLSSTEVLAAGSGLWRLASPLPRSMWGLRTISLDNSILTFGKFKNKILGQLMAMAE